MPNTIPNYEQTAFLGLQAAAANTDISDAALGQFTRMTCLGARALSAPPITPTTAPVTEKKGAATPANRRGGTGTSTRRARPDSKRATILKLLREQNGLSRGEILDKLGLKGDKSGEMSVSNALTAQGKKKEIVSQGGRWYLPEQTNAGAAANTAASPQNPGIEETEQRRTGTAG